MGWHESSARSRELGVELRKRRERAGLTGAELAARLGWSGSKVSRMESGTVAVSEVDAAIYLTYCDVHKKELDDVLNLVRAPDTASWLQEHGTRMPDELRTLIYHETTAISIAYYHPLNVPGLLQTEAYARSVFDIAGRVPKDRIAMAVQARMARQDVLKRGNPPDCVFYLHQNGLRSKVGSNQIMHEQMLQLVFLTSRPQHQIRVVPAGAEPHNVGSFMLMGYETHGPMVYVEALTTSLYLEKPDHIAAHKEILDRLDQTALDTGESRELLARLASNFDRPEDEADEEV
jgi:transcriptional regulator with XRE-family HTH domain